MRTKTSFLVAVGFLGLTATSLHAQIAINNSAANPNASAILDLQSGNAGVNKGFLPQSVALTNVTVAAPVVAPATGLLVYSSTAPTGGNGTGYYYWNGSAWSSMNSNIYGSGIDNYVARWTPNGNTLGTGIIQDNGTDASIDTVPITGFPFFVNGVRNIVGMVGYNNAVNTYAILGEDPLYIGVAGVATAKVSAGTYGQSDSGWGLYGYSSSGTGLYASGDSVGGIFFGDTAISARGRVNGINAYGTFYGINDTGYVGDNATGAGGMQAYGTVYQGIEAIGTTWGVLGVGFDPSNLFGGVYAYDYGSSYGVQSSSAGGEGVNSTGATYGVYATASDVNGFYAGVYGEDDNNIGVQGYSAGDIAGYFSDGNGDNATMADNGNGFGGWFFDAAGDYARIGDHLDQAAGTFEDAANGVYMYVCKGTAGYITNGTKSTEVKGDNGQTNLLFCNESPEVKFEDYGEGQLVNGKTHITLDPLLAKNVCINEKHPLQAFVQLEGDCNGVYVTNKTASGFDVVELNHGTSNTAFSWHIVANRASEGGEKNYADKRFPVGPGAPIAVAKGTNTNDKVKATIEKVKAEEAQKAAARAANPGITSKATQPHVANKRVASPLKVTLPSTQSQGKN